MTARKTKKKKPKLNAQKDFQNELNRIKKLMGKHICSWDGVASTIAFLHQCSTWEKVIVRNLPGPLGSLVGLATSLADFEQRQKRETRA